MKRSRDSDQYDFFRSRELLTKREFCPLFAGMCVKQNKLKLIVKSISPAGVTCYCIDSNKNIVVKPADLVTRKKQLPVIGPFVHRPPPVYGTLLFEITAEQFVLMILPHFSITRIVALDLSCRLSVTLPVVIGDITTSTTDFNSFMKSLRCNNIAQKLEHNMSVSATDHLWIPSGEVSFSNLDPFLVKNSRLKRKRVTGSILNEFPSQDPVSLILPLLPPQESSNTLVITPNEELFTHREFIINDFRRDEYKTIVLDLFNNIDEKIIDKILEMEYKQIIIIYNLSLTEETARKLTKLFKVPGKNNTRDVLKHVYVRSRSLKPFVQERTVSVTLTAEEKKVKELWPKECLTFPAQQLLRLNHEAMGDSIIPFLPRAPLPLVEEAMCIICTEIITTGLLCQPKTCKHQFHWACLHKWMKKKMMCPVDRQPILFEQLCLPNNCRSAVSSLCLWIHRFVRKNKETVILTNFPERVRNTFHTSAMTVEDMTKRRKPLSIKHIITTEKLDEKLITHLKNLVVEKSFTITKITF